MELMQAVEHYATAMKLAERYGNKHGDVDAANNAWHECKKVADEIDRLRKAIVWALGAGDDFREQGTMEGKYWWRGELAQRAGLDWDGKKYATIKTPNAK